ncbi:RmlC-like cupin domain-containing protein [Triangularia verruculosa]|uniref:RmlC-like cupin domain-containing protein n=1 Tax=Triangularia verruculosa TaxID=2587418 RepID=A0AAN6XIT8_9PEZI|nr:RmlC-like cupin domain-containing protein [Triangularia verruculosa]
MLTVPICLRRPAAWLPRIEACLAKHTSCQKRALSPTLHTARRVSTSTGNKMPPFPKPNAEPPAPKMVYFPNMTTALPSESGEFRRVLWTGLYSQVVLMTVPVGGDIGEEIHTVDQILTFTSGTGLAQVGGEEREIKAGDMVVVPAGTKHQFLNTGPNPLILYTVYSPAEHKATTVHKTKEEGDKAEEEGRDEPPIWSQRSKQENEEDRPVG